MSRQRQAQVSTSISMMTTVQMVSEGWAFALAALERLEKVENCFLASPASEDRGIRRTHDCLQAAMAENCTQIAGLQFVFSNLKHRDTSLMRYLQLVQLEEFLKWLGGRRNAPRCPKTNHAIFLTVLALLVDSQSEGNFRKGYADFVRTTKSLDKRNVRLGSEEMSDTLAALGRQQANSDKVEQNYRKNPKQTYQKPDLGRGSVAEGFDVLSKISQSGRHYQPLYDFVYRSYNWLQDQQAPNIDFQKQMAPDHFHTREANSVQHQDQDRSLDYLDQEMGEEEEEEEEQEEESTFARDLLLQNQMKIKKDLKQIILTSSEYLQIFDQMQCLRRLLPDHVPDSMLV